MDLLTVAIGLGLVVSLLFTEAIGLTAGGMIVPGYLALSLNKPADILATLAVAFITFAIVRVVSRFAIVYGRRRIFLAIIVAFVLGSLVRVAPIQASDISHGWCPSPGEFACVIGYIIPGLIALGLDRFGVIETLAPMFSSAVIVRLVLIMAGLEVLV